MFADPRHTANPNYTVLHYHHISTITLRLLELVLTYSESLSINITFDTKIRMSYAVFQNSTVNLPSDTFLKDCTVTLFGGVLRGVHTLNISLGGAFIAYPLAALDSGEPSHFKLDSISVLDGGLFKYEGHSEEGDAVVISLDGSLIVHGGGQLTGNKITVKGQCNIHFI